MPAKIPPEQYPTVFWSRVDKRGPDECWVWTRGRFSNAPPGTPNYGVMKYNGKATGAHVIAWRLTNGDIQLGQQVLHKCDNPPCCNPAHLFLGDHAVNAADKATKGRSFRCQGTMQPQAKLTEADAIKIRELYVPRLYGQKRLAREFGIARSMIFRIIHRQNWKHV